MRAVVIFHQVNCRNSSDLFISRRQETKMAECGGAAMEIMIYSGR